MRSRTTIDQVRERTDLVSLIRETVKLQQRGRSWTGLCPFHQEKSPSFSVNPERGLFYCFGCKMAGDCFKFVELTEGLTFREALTKLAERAGIELVDDRDSAGGRDKAEETRARKARDELYALNHIAAGFFEKMLHEHPFGSYARDELTKRGLLFEGEMKPVLESFRVGYAPHGWDGLATYLKQQGASPAQAETLGLLAPRTNGPGYYDSFRHRLMVGIVDVQGRVVAFSGRTLTPVPGDKVDPDRTPPKYVNSKESTIYSKGSTLFGLWQARAAIRSKAECVVVEGNFDLIAMHARGVAHVVAPMGTAFTPEQARLIKRFTQTVTLLFDGDAAGKKALWASRPILREAGVSAKAVRMPQGKDPDEFLRQRAVGEMWDVLKAARSLDELLIDDACDRVGAGSDLETKRAVLEKIRPMIEESPIDFRPVLSRRAAERLGLDVELMWRRVRAAGFAQSTAESAHDDAPTRSTTTTSASQRMRESEEEKLSRALVTTLAAAPELLEEEEIRAGFGLVAGEWALALATLRQEARAALEQGRTFGDTSMLDALPEATRDAIAAALVMPSLDPTTHVKRSPSADDDGRDAAPSAAPTSGDGSGGINGPEEVQGIDVEEARNVVMRLCVQLEKAMAAARVEELTRDIERAEASGDFALAVKLAMEKPKLKTRLLQAEARLKRDGV